MSEEFDPEVAADLALRDSTSRERGGMSRDGFAAAIRAAAPSKTIDKVPCRARCGRLADWTQEAQDAFDTFNRKLIAEREAPLDKTRIVFCGECRGSGSKLSADANRKHADKLAELIRELKDEPPPNPRRERELLEAIKGLNHPDVDGLIQAIRDKRAKQPTGKRVRASELMR